MNAFRTRQDEAVATSDDSGSALVLSLLVVLVVGSGLAVALDFVGTGFTLAPSVRDSRNESNYVQGAVEGAINQIRGSTEAGRSDSIIACPNFTPHVPSGLPGVTGKTFTVQCSGVADGSGAGVDQPRFAIHALGTGADGIRQVAGNDQLYVNGGLYSNGVVGVTGGGAANSMRVNGTVSAEGACTARVSSTDTLGLNCGAASSPLGDDPNYASAIPDAASLSALIDTGSLMTGADPIPTCSSGRVSFTPGYYGDRPDILVSRLPSSCSGSLWHFAPGRYYFDYSGVWDLDGHTIVGGTLSATPTDLSAACDRAGSGVQFVFGGASQIYTQSSSGGSIEGVELCGPAAGHSFNGAPQRIALYALKTGSAPLSQSTTLQATANPTPSAGWLTGPGIDPASRARQIDATTALATLTPSSTVSMAYGVLPSTPLLPKGAKVSSISLRVTHSVVRASAVVRLQTPGMTAPLTVALPAACVECSVPVVGLTADVLWRMLSQASVTYVATGSSGNASQVRTAALDGLRLEATYTAPTLTGLTCTGSCLFFESSNNPNVFMHGTVYSPTATWSVNIHNSGESIFDRGIIVRDIAVTMSSSSKQESSPFQLPRGTPTGRLVLFRGYVDGVERVRACVRYVDQVAVASEISAYAGWSLTVPRWLVMRTPSTQPASCTEG